MSDSAQRAFTDKLANARDLSYRIHEHIKDHLDVDPENVDWGDVAVVNSLLADLESIAEAYLP